MKYIKILSKTGKVDIVDLKDGFRFCLAYVSKDKARGPSDNIKIDIDHGDQVYLMENGATVERLFPNKTLRISLDSLPERNPELTIERIKETFFAQKNQVFEFNGETPEINKIINSLITGKSGFPSAYIREMANSIGMMYQNKLSEALNIPNPPSTFKLEFEPQNSYLNSSVVVTPEFIQLTLDPDFFHLFIIDGPDIKFSKNHIKQTPTIVGNRRCVHLHTTVDSYIDFAVLEFIDICNLISEDVPWTLFDSKAKFNSRRFSWSNVTKGKLFKLPEDIGKEDFARRAGPLLPKGYHLIISVEGIILAKN